MKKSVLVRVSLVTRVIVEDTATEQEILELAIPKLSESLIDNPHQSIDEIVDDKECPYDEIAEGSIEDEIKANIDEIISSYKK